MIRKLTAATVLTVYAIFGAYFLTGCSSAQKRRPVPAIVIPPVNPDIAPIRVLAKAASESTAKAGQSTARAVQIVERLVVAPGQEEQVKALKLELSTTADNLRITSEQLAKLQAQIPILEQQANTLVVQWQAENKRANDAYQEALAQTERADKAVASYKRASSERDVFVNLFAITLTVIVLMAAAPLIRNIAASSGAYAPVVALGLWAAAAIGSYLAAFWLIRAGLRLFVSVP